jgi:hypothetical protein
VQRQLQGGKQGLVQPRLRNNGSNKNKTKWCNFNFNFNESSAT